MGFFRFSLKQLVVAAGLTAGVCGLSVLATRQVSRYLTCDRYAAGHARRERLLLAVVDKLRFYAKEHRRYELPNDAVEAERMAVWFQGLASRHAGMGRKYREAEWRPWEPLPIEAQ